MKPIDQLDRSAYALKGKVTANGLRERVAQLLEAIRPTPIVQLELPEIKLYAKLEYYNPVWSLKDRPALWILKSAIERGEVGPDTEVIESSSGNFAIALAVFCQALGLPFMPVIDPNISHLNEALLRSACREVIKVDRRDDTGGYLKTRLAAVTERRQRSPHIFWPNQYGNVDGMLGHYHLTGAEICGAMTELDYVFVGVSSAGTIAGVSQRVKERFPRAKVIAVDAEGSVIFGGAPKRRDIPGLGAGVVPPLLAHARIDEHVIVSEVDTIAACGELRSRHGLFLGGSSGSVYHAIRQYFQRAPSGPAKPSVLFLCADRGSAYLDTIYNEEWCARLREAG